MVFHPAIPMEVSSLHVAHQKNICPFQIVSFDGLTTGYDWLLMFNVWCLMLDVWYVYHILELLLSTHHEKSYIQEWNQWCLQTWKFMVWFFTEPTLNAYVESKQHGDNSQQALQVNPRIDHLIKQPWLGVIQKSSQHRGIPSNRQLGMVTMALGLFLVTEFSTTMWAFIVRHGGFHKCGEPQILHVNGYLVVFPS